MSYYIGGFTSLITVSKAVRSTVSLGVSCPLAYCGVTTMQTTIVEMGLSDHSVLTYSDVTSSSSPFASLFIAILNASAVDSSIISVSSIAMNNSFSGFGLIRSNSRVSITNTNSDRDVQTFATGTNLQVQDNSSVALQGSTGSTSCYSSCDLTLRPSSWLSGSSLLLDAPRLNLAITGGVFQNFTLTVTRMRALSFNVTAPLTLVHCSFQLSSTSNSYDYQLTTLPALLVMNATTFSWAATYVEAILPWVSATTAQVRMYSGTQITLSAQSYFMTSQKSLVFSSAASTLPMPGTTLDVQFPSYSMSTSVTIGSINATGSTLRLRSATTVWVSGTFTANTTLALIGVTSNASIVNMPNFIVSDYSTVVIDVVGIINPGFMLVPFQPSAITRGSRLEINAPSSLLYTQSYTFFEAWNISGSSVSSNSSIYINVANVGVNILSLTSVGCSFTIIARVITSIGAALGNSSAATYLTATSSSTAPSAMDLTSVSQGGYTNVTLIATVANTYLVDSIVVGVRMLNSNITVIGPQCSGCNGLFISGSFLTASTVSVRVLGRTVFLNDFNITSRHNAAVVSAQEVSVFGLSLVDSTLDLKVTTAPTFLSFEPRLLLRTNVSLTVIVTMTVVTYQPYQYSTTDNALWALLITNVSLSGGSSMALVSQYQFAGTILSPSQIPAADILPTVLTVTGSNWESGASLWLTDYRSNVQLPSSLGNSTQRGVSISVKCNTLTTFNGTYDFGASVTAAALNMSGAMSTISSVHGGSNVRIAVQGPSICTNISREFRVMDVAGGSEVNISIVDTGIISTNNTCAASLCSSLAASSSVHLEAQRVAINSIVTDSRITARAERFSVNAASALFTNSTVMLTEIGPQLTAPALPSRQAFHLRSAANSALHLSLWNPINAVVVPEVLIDATDVVESNVSLFFNGSGNANNIDAPPLRLIGTGARSNITIWSVGSYTASGVFAESSSVRVSSINGGQIALQDVIVIGSTSQHIIEVSTSSLSVRQLSNFQILVANVTAASPIVTHFDLGGVVNNNDISNCSATWVLMSNITTNNSEYQRNNTTLCSVNVTVHGDWAATKVTALVPLLDRNGAPISAAASVATSSLNINDVAPRIGHNTIIADGLGSLHATGAWSSGTRVAITRLNQLLFVNASMITSTLTVDGVQGSSLTVGVHGTITDSSVAVREWGTSSIFAAAAATRSILDIPLCILTAALARNSSVLIRGFTRRWYPGNSSTALLSTVTHFMEPTPPPTNTSTLSSPQLVSLVVSPIAILPSGVDGTSQIILEDITVSLRLPSGLTPLTSVPFSTLSPTGYVDSTVIRVNDTSLTFTAVAAQIPPPQANGGSLLSIVNASIDAQVDAVGTAMIRVAAVSASIADPSARLEVVGTAFSAIFNTTVSEVLLVEAFVAANVTKGVPTSTPRGSIVVDDANFNMTTRDDGTVQRQPLGVSLVAIRPRTEFIMVERNATVTVLWISFNESVANSSTRCDNITATYSPKLSGTTVFSCTTTYQAFVNVTTLSMTPPATTPGLLNFSATVMRTVMNIVVGSRPTSLGGDGLLRHVTAIDVRNHQTLSLALFDSIFSLLLEPVNVSNSDVPALQRFLLAAPSALVFVQNDNASSHTASLSQGTTKVTVSGVTSFDFSASVAQLININIPCVIVVAQTIVRSLSFSRLGNSSTLRAALVSVEFVPFRLPSTALAALNTTVSDTVVAADGGGGLCPLVLVTRAVIPTQILSTVVSRRRAALALDDNTNVTLPRVSLTVQRSTLQGISSALTFHATDRDDGTATMDISRSSMNIVNSTLQCSGAGQTSSYAVAALGPNDAMTMTWAISKFQNCVRLISGGDSVTIDQAANLTSNPGINWACNLWNQRSLTRSGIRELLGGVASIYLAPNIDSRYGKEICRSYSTSLMPSDSVNVSSLTLYGSETATIAHTLSLGFTVSHPPSKTSTASENVTITLSLSQSTSASESTSRSFSDSLSSSTSNSYSRTATPSPTNSFSPTVTSTRSHTETDSPTISIDPCNTTFRDDSDSFIRHATVLTDITQPGSNLHRNETAATFLTIDRVAFATAKSLRVQIGFSTYLRNFYYATNMSWFFVPRVQNCIADQFELVNATDLIVRISYDPDVSLSHTVDGDYACNLTFSTDIFQCQLMTNFTFNFSAAIYVSGTPSIISPASEAVTKLTSTIVTLLSSGAALLQQSRADSLGTLASCQFSLVDQPSVQDSPTQLGFGSELQYYYRGLVVGNIAIIILGFVCLVLMLACAIALCGRRKVKLYGDTRAKYAAHNVLEVSGSARIEEDVSAALTFSDVGVAEHDPMIYEDEMMTLPAFTEESNALSLDSNFLVAVNKDEDVLSAMYRETRDNVVVDLGNNNSGAFSLNPSGEGVLTSFDRDPMNIFSEEEETSKTVFESKIESGVGSEKHRLAIPAEIDCDLNASIGTRVAANEMVPSYRRPQMSNMSLIGERQETFREALQRTCGILAFPSAASIPIQLLADSTTLASVRLLVHPIDSYDLHIGAAGVTVFSLFLIASGVAVKFLKRVPTDVELPATHPLAISRKRINSTVGKKTNNKITTLKLKVILWLRYWLLPTIEYSPSRMRERHNYGMMRLLFEDTSFPLFVCCDLALSLLIAALVGVGISRREVCVYLAGVGALGYIAFTALIIIARPNINRLSLAASIGGAVCGTISSLFTFISMYQGTLILGTINQYLSVVMIGISMVQFVSSVVGVVVWMRVVGVVVFSSCDALLKKVGLGNERQSIGMYHSPDGDDVDSLDGSLTPPLRTEELNESEDDEEFKEIIEEQAEGSDVDVMNTQSRRIAMIDDDDDDAARARNINDEFAHLWSYNSLAACNNSHDEVDMQLLLLNTHSISDAIREFPIASSRGGEGIL
ncbi:transmembrane protein, putative [Bodo saltans]|uniref:Transmembrane protein, putative n=1 Tax=Bodo saltans TaxID=75058 RepID=A0A0S4IPZ7_BODSA|nr:transmembrane protein, putative [Bodo saltans]|eukprot:CUE56225.1 transmembrane protein, putative [Bodo saltans]